MSPEAGWYADPTDDTAVRWWDGSSWSAQTRPAPRELAMAGAVVGTAATETAQAPIVTVGAPSAPPAAPAPAPARAPAPAPTASAPTPAATDADEVVDRSRPGSRRAAPPAPAPAPGPAAPADDEDVDRSRPGARRQVVVPPPDEASTPAVPPSAPRAPASPAAAWVDGAAAPAHTGHGVGGGVTPGFGATTPGFGAVTPGFATAPAGFGPADLGPVHGGAYKAPRSWKAPVAIGAVVVLVLGVGAVVGIPRYQAAQAQAKAALAPDVLLQSAPRALAGQKKMVIPGEATNAMTQDLTALGASWAWGAAYGTRDAFTLYVASDVPMVMRPEAVKALSSRDAATTMLAEVSSGMTSGSKGATVTGTPAEYSSPVGGKTWCMPITMSGVAGGYCLWTSGKEMLQVLSLPGLEQVAAKSENTALTQMAAAVTQAGPTSSLVPKPSASASAK